MEQQHLLEEECSTSLPSSSSAPSSPPPTPTPTQSASTKPPALKRARPVPLRTLRLSSAEPLPPSPLTPASVFTFELTESPAFLYPSSARKLSKKEHFVFDDPVPDLQPIPECDESSRRPSQASIVSTHWPSVRTIALVLFLVRAQFTVYFASLYSLAKTADPSIDPLFFSWINALYSLSCAISAPTFGYLAHRFGFLRPASFTLLLMLVTNVLYVFVDRIPFYTKYYVLVVRAVVGVAAGGSNILNTYWSTVTVDCDRATAAAYSDAAFSLGLALGPLFQAVFSQVGYPGTAALGISLNMYTLPALTACLFVAIAAVLLCCSFDDASRPRRSDKSVDDALSASEDGHDDLPKWSLAVCIAVRTVQMFFYANLETIFIPYLQWMFGVDKQAASLWGSSLVSASGLAGFAFLVGYVWTGAAKRVRNDVGVCVGIIISLLYLVCTFSYPSYTTTITTECEYAWCPLTSTVPVHLFIAAHLLLFSIGFPLLNVHVSALLSSLLGHRSQAVWHGTAMSVATLSRVVGPPITMSLLEWAGLRPVWHLQIAIHLLLLFTFVLTFFSTELSSLVLPPRRNSLRKDEAIE